MNNISGDYQYQALHQGNPIQSQWHKNRLNLIKYLGFLSKDDKVLDGGCGSGNVIFEFAPVVKTITGIDNNPQCIEFIRLKIKDLSMKNAKAVKDDLLSIKLSGRNFNKAVMTEVIEHFNEQQVKTILEQMKKLMANNCKILITTPNYKSPWVIIEHLIDHLNLGPKLWGEQHQIKFNASRLNKLLTNSGFQVQENGTLNTISPFLAVISRKWADQLSFWEFKHLPFGNLLYVVASYKQA